MEIRILKACKLKLPSGAEQTFPPGWQGEVDAAAAGLWIRSGHAEAVRSAGAAAVVPQFTSEQAEVLAGAADMMLAQHVESSFAPSDSPAGSRPEGAEDTDPPGRVDDPGAPAPARRARAPR